MTRIISVLKLMLAWYMAIVAYILHPKGTTHSTTIYLRMVRVKEDGAHQMRYLSVY